MNVVDSSCWLEFAQESPVKDIIAPIVADTKNLIVPTIILYEMLKKLTTTNGVDYANEFIQGMLKAQVVPLDVFLSLNAAAVSRKYKLPAADSIIYATAKQHNAVLWTTDQHFDGLPSVRYFDKTKR